jgi:hypothetical protein
VVDVVGSEVVVVGAAEPDAVLPFPPPPEDVPVAVVVVVVDVGLAGTMGLQRLTRPLNLLYPEVDDRVTAAWFRNEDASRPV